ncbi:carboxypeptidase-like regulatory domain-containing protein [Flavobacterium sp. RNTU_13]|uniref:carboxypeptidase-like regulatory domain-containing protein n=1 Tax=Flavobacterium sp. RNTU_13 TaxID=3375145 RepID=UPI003987A2BB
MTNRIRISIPKPCHENWDTMAPAERGRFCMACQKQVIDFTKASDREIVAAMQQDKNLCGRFVSTQLNRNVTIRKEKNSITTVLAFALSLITLSATAQEKKKSQQVTHTKTTTKKIKKHQLHPVIITGTVVDSTNKPLVSVTVLIKGKPTLTETDSTGTFKIQANIGDKLVFETIGYSTNEILIKDITPITTILQEDHGAVVTAYRSHRISVITGAVAVIERKIITQKRTFFGRIFHKIGNLFSKNE